MPLWSPYTHILILTWGNANTTVPGLFGPRRVPHAVPVGASGGEEEASLEILELPIKVSIAVPLVYIHQSVCVCVFAFINKDS